MKAKVKNFVFYRLLIIVSFFSLEIEIEYEMTFFLQIRRAKKAA